MNLERLFHHAPVGLCYFDTDLRYVFVNEWLANINGLTVQQHIGQRIDDILPDVAAAITPQLRGVIETGEPVIRGTAHAETAAHPGSKRHYEHNYYPDRSDHGAVMGVSCVVQDVTENRMAEALRLSEARLREAQRTAHVGTWEWDMASDTAWWSDEMYRIFGVEREEFPATRDGFLSFVHPDDRAMVQDAMDSAVRDGQPYTTNFRIHRKDGSQRFLYSSAEVVRNGEAVRVRGTMQDITERKEAERELREQDERIRLILDSTADGIITIDRAGIVQSVNAAVKRIFGYDADEVVGQNIKLLMPSPYHEEHDGYLERYHRTGEARILNIEREVEGRRKDGTSFPLAIRVRKMGSARSYVGSVQDITDRKEAENHLRRSREQLRALNTRLRSVREEEQKALALELHDEIGQAMTALQLDLHSLREADLDRDTVEARLDAMMALSTTVIEAGRRISARLRPSVLDDLGLAAVVESLASDFKERTGTACTLEAQGADSPVRGDVSTAFFRILQEVLTNVIRHAEASSVVIRLDLSGDPPTLDVVDNGRGITQEEIDFPTSLGLLGMKERATAVGGTVEFGAGDDGGTVVRIAIPRGGLERRKE